MGHEVLAGNPDVQALADTAEQQRAHGATTIATHIADRFGLRAGLTVVEAADILWTLTAPEIPIRLVHRRRWTWDRYQTWLTDTLLHAVLGPQTDRSRRPRSR